MKIKPEKKKPKRITPTYLHNAGLYYLQRYAASSAHFRQVLLRKVKRSCRAHPDQDFASCQTMVEEIIVKFQRSGLLNDTLYIQALVSSLRRQGRSEKYIVQKLMQKGASKTDTKNALQTQEQEKPESEMQAAQIFVRKKRLGLNPEKDLQKMARAGFSYEIARRALKGVDELMS